MSMKNSNDTIGNRTRDLPACSIVPQPNAPPGTSSDDLYLWNYLLDILTAIWSTLEQKLWSYSKMQDNIRLWLVNILGNTKRLKFSRVTSARRVFLSKVFGRMVNTLLPWNSGSYFWHSGFGGLEVVCWPLVPQVRGFKPGRSRRIFKGK